MKFLLFIAVIFAIIILRKRDWPWKKIIIGFNLLYLLFVVWFIFPLWKEEGEVPWSLIGFFVFIWPFANIIFIHNTRAALNEQDTKPINKKCAMIILFSIFIVLVALLIFSLFAI